jgi:putative ABC transport system permease protein
MNVITRGIRNAFRNQIRTFSIIVIVGLSIGLSLSMLVARQAVSDKITSVKSSVGNTVSVSPAGVQGFEGGGNALTTTETAKLDSLQHVTSVTETLSDRLTTDNTSLQSAVDAGSLGQRFSQNNGTGFSGGQAPQMMTGGSSTSSGTGTSTDTTGATGTTRTFTPPVTVVGTTDPTSSTTGTITISDGKAFDSSSSENVALIGTSLATKNSLKVGSTFTAYGTTITVVGIYDTGSTFSNNQVLMPLKTLQTLSDQADAITSATVHVDSIDNVSSVTTAAKTALGDAADVTNDSATAETSVAPLENIRTITLYSLFGSVAAGAVIILLTMIMIVRERRREIGVIKAIGASNVNVMTQFASEAVTLTLLGSIVGIVMGIFASNPITKLLVTNSTSSTATQTGMGGPGGQGGRILGGIGRNVTNVTATVGWDIILYGLGVAVLIAIIGSALASFFIAKIRPAEVMRAE